MKKNKMKGFSLFELLIALSLIVVLSSFVVPNIRNIQNKSNAMSAEVNLRTFQSCLENYYFENNTYPVGDLTAKGLYDILESDDIIRTMPINPYTKKGYADTDSKGKILYSAVNGENYSLTLFEADGTTIGLVLNRL
jgi:prepilin-type N-terminal cleavage/methylation domain-containing protein